MKILNVIEKSLDNNTWIGNLEITSKKGYLHILSSQSLNVFSFMKKIQLEGIFEEFELVLSNQVQAEGKRLNKYFFEFNPLPTTGKFLN